MAFAPLIVSMQGTRACELVWGLKPGEGGMCVRSVEGLPLRAVDLTMQAEALR